VFSEKETRILVHIMWLRF